MITWSLCMIVKNEEKNIEKCLNSIKDLFDEIIIVDTGSTDNTKNIIEKYTENIYDFIWINDFSAARNHAFSLATKDYIMWLDADDILKEEDYQKLKKLKKNMNKDYDIIMMKYNIAFDQVGNPTFSYYRERLLKRERNYKWNDRVHEYIELSGNIHKEDIAITHDKTTNEISTRNLNIYKEKELNKEKFTPRNLYYYGRELYDHSEFDLAINKLEEFLNTKKGWIEDNINTCYLLSYCYASLNNEEESLECLFKTFNYDIPRKKTCSLIGNYFLNQKEYIKAIYWYELALSLKITDNLSFHESDYDYFIPYINLCVSYDRIGNREEAIKYHKLCKEIKPDNNLVRYNEEYFNDNFEKIKTSI